MPAWSASVAQSWADHGNILFESGGVQVVLTKSGHDSEPWIAPDNARVVFVRTDPVDPFLTSIFEVDVRSKEVTLVYSGALKLDGFGGVPLGNPALGDGGKTLYVIAHTGVTTGKFVAIDVRTGFAKSIADAAGFDMIQSGPHAGEFLLYQRKIDLNGFPYYIYTLYSKDFRELGVAGPGDMDVELAVHGTGNRLR